MSGRGVGERTGAVPDTAAGAAPAVVAAGVAVAVAAVLLAHVLGAGSLDPVALTVSDYVAVPGGGVLLGLAAAGLATAGAALVRAVPGRGWPRAVAVLLSAWCVALVLVAVFPTNAPGSAPDLAAAVHRWAGAGVFALPPVAGLLVLRRTGAPVTAWAPTVAAGAGALVFLLCHAPAVLSGAPPFPLLGVVERVAHLLLCGQVLALGRRAGSPATPRVAAVSR
ncbi:DUF998 domain-containing protein [Pseudonocardia sediminis]|nr:DUF998 domain-containing protein [Pseudonocardia sediminis]